MPSTAKPCFTTFPITGERILINAPHTVALVVDKPYAARVLAPFAETYWPGCTILALPLNRVGAYEFRYPRGLRLADYPLTRLPTWKARSAPPETLALNGGRTLPAGVSVIEALRTASDIVLAADHDPSTAAEFHTLVAETLGDERASQPHIAIELSALDPASIERALQSPSSTSATAYRDALRAGAAKRFFDFNFNANSLALLSPALRAVGVDAASHPMSKYGLQLLFRLTDAPPLPEFDLLQRMQHWGGTGRHAPAALGSAASRWKIVENLAIAGLLETSQGGGYSVSPLGRHFLERLHPDCRDSDLPARLACWQAAWPDSRPAMERYLRTFFGKQKRFLSRQP